METRENDTDPVLDEISKNTQNNDIPVNSMNNGPINDQTSNSECKGVIKENEGEVKSHSTPHVYRQDVVRCNNSGMIGIITAVAGDSDSDSSETDDEEEEEDDDDEDEVDNPNEEQEEGASQNENDNNSDGNDETDMDCNNDKRVPLSPGQAQVLWLDDSEKTKSLKDITVIDRGFLHGDYLASALDPTGQVGLVVDVSISVDLRTHEGSIIKDVSSRDLKRVRAFTSGDYVVLGPWLGRVDDVLDNVTVLFDDGSVCKVKKADPLNLRKAGKNVLDEDGSFQYYPGQTVRASTSSVLKSSIWLSGSWKPNRLQGTVTKVTVGSVFIYWIASAGYGPDSSTPPAEEQSPNNLKLLSCFSHANWQLRDWCLFPSVALSSSSSLDKDLSKSEVLDSDINESDYVDMSHCGDSEVIESVVNNESMDVESASTMDNGNSDGTSSLISMPSTSSLAASKDHVPHRKNIRKVIVKKDKKVRKKEDNFERALVIVNTRTKVDVAWQDGTTEYGLLSTTLIPIDNPGDHEFVAEQYVVEKVCDESDDSSEIRRVGVVKYVNAKERTTCVRWLKPVSRAEDPREFGEEEVVSVYELEGHPDYDYCYGDVVVRLSPVSTQTGYHGEYVEETSDLINPDEVEKLGLNKTEDASGDETCLKFSDLSWVGNITGLTNGDIEVTWADGMVSTVGPQAIYVVGRDDDNDSIAAGSGTTDGGASWETMDDNDVDIAIQNFIEVGLENNTNHESEDNSETGENNVERNEPLSIPRAALDFVARLATGIFSRGRKHLDPFPLGSRNEHGLESQTSKKLSDKRDFSDDSSSEKSNAINDNSIAQNTDDKQEEHVATDATNLDIALCNSESIEKENSSGYENNVSGFQRFDIVRDPAGHHFLVENGQKSNERKWLKKVQQDWGILQNNLPDGIYVRAYEDRMDLLRAVIVGAYGTPYQDGLFFFDFHLPLDYPDVPPSAYYHSGGWRINPNLYEEGKVCLSLLNTWTGRGNEVWDPDSSSILQVLVSLQGLVLNSRPYFNEAGYDKQVGTAEGEKNSLSYNENTFLLNCKTMMFLMRRPPKDFEDLVRDHFKRHGDYILKACDAYMKGFLIGSLAKDASTNDNINSNSTSVGFKLMLAKIVPKLFLALNEVGVDCEEFKHLQKPKS